MAPEEIPPCAVCAVQLYRVNGKNPGPKNLHISSRLYDQGGSYKREIVGHVSCCSRRVIRFEVSTSDLRGQENVSRLRGTAVPRKREKADF